MKKKLEAELISIAHRILKLKGKEDIIMLHLEAQKLYEKIAILKFYEENIAVASQEVNEQELEELLENKESALTLTPQEIEIQSNFNVQEEKEVEEKQNNFETITKIESSSTNQIDAAEEIVKNEEKSNLENENKDFEENSLKTETPSFIPSFELAIEDTKTEGEKPLQKQMVFDDLLGSNYKEPEFVKVDEVAKEYVATNVADVTESFEKKEVKDMPNAASVNFEAKSISLNDTLIKGLNVGLNDKIAFVKHLFAGSNEDFNRVISQLNSFNSFDEAKDFIHNLVKPDYNNWEGKEDYEIRFIEIVEKKFL